MANGGYLPRHFTVQYNRPAVKKFSSSSVIMNSRWLWNLHQRHKFLRAEPSRNILKFRVSEIAFPGVFKRYLPLRMLCCFVRILVTLGTMPGFELGFDYWGNILYPLAKILGDIFIFRGTDKLIFIQHFFLHSYRQANKNIFFYLILVIQEKWYKQEKLSYWCQDFFFLITFKERINDHASHFKTFHSRISSRHPLVNFNSFLNY